MVPITVQNTAQLVNVQGFKGLIYGKAGVGKTMLAATAPASLVIATEPGLLSLRRYGVPFIEAFDIDRLKDVAKWIASAREARQYGTFMVDSLSETLEMVLAAERKRVGQKEPRKAYNELVNLSLEVIRLFRDIQGPNVVFTAKQERVQDGDSGVQLYQPKFPGKAVGIEAPYFFDFVFHMHVATNPQTRETYRIFRTAPDNQHEAKDRSGMLAELEPANLGYIFDKIMGRVT